MWPSVPRLNKTLQKKKKKNLNDQLPLLQWTPPAAAHNTVRLWQLSHHSPADAVWSARPRHHSSGKHPVLWGSSTLHFISPEKRRTGGVRPHLLIFTFTRNLHREDVQRSLHCGFGVRWVASYLCLTAAAAVRRRSNTLRFLFQDPLRGSKVNHFPSTVHSAVCGGFVSQPFFFLSRRMWILLRYKHGVCHGHHCLWYHPDHPHHCICLLPCDSSQKTKRMGPQWWWALIY